MADVHLGARHHDLGAIAAEQRERQFAAFRRAIDVALDQRVDLVLIAGDLFDSNAQPRRSVERAAGELKRLAAAGIPSVAIPGTHDCYDTGSIYRVFDLPGLASDAATPSTLTVLTPERREVAFPALDVVVHGFVHPAKRASQSPLAGFRVPGGDGTWHVGLVHGSLLLPGKVEQDDVLFTAQEVEGSGLAYLALGHWHSLLQGRAGATLWAYPGAPEPVAVDQDRAGNVLLVTLGRAADGSTTAEARPVAVGRTRFQRLDVDAAQVVSQDELCRRLETLGDPDLVLDVRLVGVAPERLDVHEDEIERELGGRFLRLRVRDGSTPALPDGPLPPPDTIAGAFIRELQGEIEAAEGDGRRDRAEEAREALRIGRLLLDDPKRVTLV